MGFRNASLQVAFEVPGDCGFRVWGYGTTDPLEDVLAPGYLRGASSLLRPGDLLLIRSFTRFDAASERRRGEDRQAFAMVRRCDPRQGPILRLVMDLGRPSDPDGAQRRPPGRPRKADAAQAAGKEDCGKGD